MGVLLLCDKPSLGSFILNSYKSYISISSAVLQIRKRVQKD